MAKKITDYLPEHKPQEATSLVQAKVSKTLKEEFLPLLDARGNTMIEFIEGAMQQFIDEHKGKRVS
jgi:hypothetical protein